MEHRTALQQQMDTSSCSYGDEDGTSGFIDMEVTSTNSSPKFHNSSSAPIQSKEFEFQMDSTTSYYPADELFYKGKLLPLHLPPRLKLVEKLALHNLNVNATAPFDISPIESCRPSTELNPDDYFFDWSKEITRLHATNSWSRKFKQLSLGKKLETYRTYLLSLFKKSASGKSTSNADEDDQQGHVLKAKECVNKYIKVSTNKKKHFGSLQHEKFNISSLVIKNGKELAEDGQIRKSFSGAMNWSNAATTVTTLNTLGSSSSSSSSSSSFSFNFNGFYELQLVKRSSSENSNVDSSVDGAIAYCKQSQKNAM